MESSGQKYIKDTNSKLYNPNSYGYLDAGLSIIIFVLSCALYSKLVSFLLSLTGPFYKYIQSNYGFKLVINVLLAQIYVMLYSVIYAKIRKVSLFSGGGYTCKVDLVSASMGCVLALGVILLFSDLHELIVSYLDQLFPQNAINVSDSNGDLWILLEAFILAPILPAFAEEAFMRGIVFRSLEKFGAFFAIRAMGVFFALFHGNPSQLFIQMIGGMLFGMLFYATKNFFVTMVVHWFYNLFVVISSVYLEIIKELSNTAYLLSQIMLPFLGVVLIIVGGVYFYKKIIKARQDNPFICNRYKVYLFDEKHNLVVEKHAKQVEEINELLNQDALYYNGKQFVKKNKLGNKLLGFVLLVGAFIICLADVLGFISYILNFIF